MESEGEDWRLVGKGGAVDLSRLMETGLVVFQEG